MKTWQWLALAAALYALARPKRDPAAPNGRFADGTPVGGSAAWES